jgi:SAM-dependent methyltransferase
LTQIDKETVNGRPMKIVALNGGRGVLAPCLAVAGHNVTVVARDYREDSDDPEIEARFLAWAAKNELDLRFGSIFNAPVANASADVVLCLSDFENLPYREYALRDALRLLKPDGILVLWLQERSFTTEKLQALLQNCGIDGEDLNTLPVALVIRARDRAACEAAPVQRLAAS